LKSLEGHLGNDAATGRLSHGDTPTLADICMVGHVTASISNGIDLAPYPTVKRVFDTAMALPAFATAHPLVQADTPEAMRRK
jgi:maleylacetoacetate isomerase/maleylpyruvate isomerase